MTLEKLRAYGNLPDAARLADIIITPHLESAKRDIKRQLAPGLYASIIIDPEHEKYPDLEEAVLALAVANSLPASNAMYSEGMADYVENGIGRRWLTPAELDSRIALYEAKSAKLVSVLMTGIKIVESEGSPKPRYRASLI